MGTLKVGNQIAVSDARDHFGVLADEFGRRYNALMDEAAKMRYGAKQRYTDDAEVLEKLEEALIWRYVESQLRIYIDALHPVRYDGD